MIETLGAVKHCGHILQEKVEKEGKEMAKLVPDVEKQPRVGHPKTILEIRAQKLQRTVTPETSQLFRS